MLGCGARARERKRLEVGKQEEEAIADTLRNGWQFKKVSIALLSFALSLSFGFLSFVLCENENLCLLRPLIVCRSPTVLVSVAVSSKFVAPGRALEAVGRSFHFPFHFPRGAHRAVLVSRL
jgi:hypothetical protein